MILWNTSTTTRAGLLWCISKGLKADVETSLELPAGFNPFTEVGRGRIDWTRILGAAEKAGVKHIFVEQDETDGSLLESFQMSYNYLSEMKI